MKVPIFLLLALCALVDSANILVIFHMGSPSHYVLGKAYFRALANAGHDVTVISPFEDTEKPKNGSITNVILTGFFEEHQKMLGNMNLEKRNDGIFKKFLMPFFMFNNLIKKAENVLQHPNVQKLLQSDKKFDLVVYEQFLNEVFSGIAYHYNASVIMFSTVGPNYMVNAIVANPSPTSYIPEVLSDFGSNMTFFQRVANMILSLMLSIIRQISTYYQNQILHKIFPDAPDLDELVQNTSLVLVNSHVSNFAPVPTVPNIIEIGGFHVQPPKKLPNDLQELLDEAKDGVIYFSMGSNLKSENLPAHIRDAILKSVAKFPKIKVLWKWEDDNFPNKPANVETRKWFPQQDILAHKNIKLFITHGGLLSTTETIYHGVPILAIPMFADQNMNAKRARENGYGIMLQLQDINENNFTNALEELLSNPEYSRNAKFRSKLMHDRPMKPIDSAVYWTEYVIRHKGAPHLKVAGVDLPWYQYYSIDVLVFLIRIPLIIYYLGKWSLKIWRRISPKKLKIN